MLVGPCCYITKSCGTAVLQPIEAVTFAQELCHTEQFNVQYTINNRVSTESMYLPCLKLAVGEYRKGTAVVVYMCSLVRKDGPIPADAGAHIRRAGTTANTSPSVEGEPDARGACNISDSLNLVGCWPSNVPHCCGALRIFGLPATQKVSHASGQQPEVKHTCPDQNTGIRTHVHVTQSVRQNV